MRAKLESGASFSFVWLTILTKNSSQNQANILNTRNGKHVFYWLEFELFVGNGIFNFFFNLFRNKSELCRSIVLLQTSTKNKANTFNNLLLVL